MFLLVRSGRFQIPIMGTNRPTGVMLITKAAPGAWPDAKDAGLAHGDKDKDAGLAHGDKDN